MLPTIPRTTLRPAITMEPAKDHNSNVNQYAYALSKLGLGTFLYQPAASEAFHPGSVGYFDGQGKWNEIADVSKPEQHEPFQPFTSKLELKATETQQWKETSGDTSSGNSINGSLGVAEPFTTLGQAEIHAGYSKSSSQTAVLITSNEVKISRYHSMFRPRVSKWVKENAKALMVSEYASTIKDYGLWAIQETSVTDNYAIKMSQKNDLSLKAGMELAANGIGKIGAGGETFKKLSNEGWRTAETTTVWHYDNTNSRSTLTFCRAKMAGLWRSLESTSSLEDSFTKRQVGPYGWHSSGTTANIGQTLKDNQILVYALTNRFAPNLIKEKIFVCQTPIGWGDKFGDGDEEYLVDESTPLAEEHIEELRKYRSELEEQEAPLSKEWHSLESAILRAREGLLRDEKRLWDDETMMGETPEEDAKVREDMMEQGRVLCEETNKRVEVMDEIAEKARSIRAELRFMKDL
jgi:hypothetical protein